MTLASEVNFDGLVGPSHNYAGLSYGNVASQNNGNQVSDPKEAALQGLRKMKALSDMGFHQGILLPQERPYIPALRQVGFSGTDAEILSAAARTAPALLASVCSASSMWTANAATVSPSADTADGRVHFTAANLNAKLHRSVEHEVTSRMLAAVFPSAAHFAHHPALPAVGVFGDEGAANHTRLCRQYGEPGVELFVYGAEALRPDTPKPGIFPARHTREASEAVARLHGLRSDRVVFAQQNPEAIDAGVFHNDVIAVGNGPVLFYHEKAFLNEAEVMSALYSRCAEGAFQPLRVDESEVPLQDAVSSYLFNSQLLTRPDGTMLLVVPSECEETDSVRACLQRLVASPDNPVSAYQAFDLKQSMQNGGGPACLRLRVVLTEEQRQHVAPGCLMTTAVYERLTEWVNRHYRDRLGSEDFADPMLLNECRTALDELTGLLGIGSVYDFQRA